MLLDFAMMGVAGVLIAYLQGLPHARLHRHRVADLQGLVAFGLLAYVLIRYDFFGKLFAPFVPLR